MFFQIETSFCGSDIGPRAGLHLRGHDWNKLGESFGQTLLELLLPNSEVMKRAGAQLEQLVSGKSKESGSVASSIRQDGDVVTGESSDGNIFNKSERSGSGQSSRGKRNGSSTPKLAKSRRSSSDNMSAKVSLGRAKTSSGRSRSKRKSVAGKSSKTSVND